MTPFPAVIDNTIRGAFVMCPTRARYAYFQHRSPREASVHTHAGGAFARGLEVARREFYDRKTPERRAVDRGHAALLEAYGGFECPPKYQATKSKERVAGALYAYFDEYPLGEDTLTPAPRLEKMDNGGHAIEFVFSLTIPGVYHPETATPLHYAGRCDMIALTAGGAMYVVDEKTSGRGGEQWRKQWELDSQPTGYVWAARQLGYPVAGAAMRGVILRKYDYGFEPAFVLRPDWQVQRWLEQLQRDVRAMIAMWRSGEWSLTLTKEACGAYNGCPFVEVCLARDPGAVLAERYVERKWDPLAVTDGGEG